MSPFPVWWKDREAKLAAALVEIPAWAQREGAEWRLVPTGSLDAVMALDPADHATKSRDYGRGFAEALRIVQGLLSPHPSIVQPYCDWCGRAIYQGKFQLSRLRWFAVKGVERGYDPLACDANTEDGTHEPAGQPAAADPYRQDEVTK